MPDDPIVNPGEQTPSPTDWEKRFKGQVALIEKLTLEKRDLEGQLAAKASETEQLRAQLSIKDTEKTAAVGQYTQQITEITTAKAQLEKDIAELRALQLKVKVAKEMNRPDLLRILDTVPAMQDEAALKTVFDQLVNFADSAVHEREKQLLSGVVPAGGGGGAMPAPTVPQSEVEWGKHIETLPLGSPERAKAFDQYWDWLNTKHNPNRG